MNEAPVARAARHRAAGWSGMSAAVWFALVVVVGGLVAAGVLFLF